MRPGHSSTGVYLYCITEGQPMAPEEGLHPSRPVHSLVYEDLVAVASLVPLEEFGEETLRAHLEDPDWLEREVRGHERVIEKVMVSRTVLPLKFCTIFLTEEKVRAFLERDQDKFRRALARLREKEEWEVKMYCEPACRADAQGSDVAASLSGREYLLRKKATQAAAQDAALELRRQAQRAVEILSGCVEEIQLKPAAVAYPPRAPKLALDAVCLLAKPRFPVFRSRLEGLGNEVADKGFRLQLSGPWPPYHFTAEAQDNVGPP